jgi:hypothetical protein
MEVTYLANLIKKKIDRNKTMPVTELAGILRKGMRTLDHQMKELLLSKFFDALRWHYEESEDENIMINTCLKLLLRSKSMFEAR